MSASPIPLLVGEVFLDYTITERGVENKLRLGGIVHAARGFWSLGQPFSVAAVLPEYLDETARKYLEKLGCVEFHIAGRVNGAPNVIALFDATEAGDQGYEILLREEKSVELSTLDLTTSRFQEVLMFPGSYDLRAVCRMLPSSATLSLDVAYDLNDPSILSGLTQPIRAIFLSTSSTLFHALEDKNVLGVAAMFAKASPSIVVLKENRGGARMLKCATGEVEAIPAQLGATVNSVGVGDVFAAAFTTFASRDVVEAAWRASYAAAAYSQTTYPDQLKSYVERDLKLGLDDLRQLSGTLLSWEGRNAMPIYLAAPDFKEGERAAIDDAVAALTYHNFAVRRPVVENGELPPGSPLPILQQTYLADHELLKKCALVFAIPIRRDPGTLVEIGIAVEANIPVVVFDPRAENTNTMVMGSAARYSSDLEACVSAVFEVLGRPPAQ